MDKATGSAVDLPDMPAVALLLDDATMNERVTEGFCLLFSVECLSVCHIFLFVGLTAKVNSNGSAVIIIVLDVNLRVKSISQSSLQCAQFKVRERTTNTSFDSTTRSKVVVMQIIEVKPIIQTDTKICELVAKSFLVLCIHNDSFLILSLV